MTAIVKPQNYIRIGTFPLDAVLPFVVFGDPRALRRNGTPGLKRQYLGHNVKMCSWRYQTFARKGIKCVGCGIEGKFFALEKDNGNHKDSYHFNLYAVDSDGEEVLMTKDHMIPISKGGKDSLDNFQTMCTKCNHAKKDAYGKEN